MKSLNEFLKINNISLEQFKKEIQREAAERSLPKFIEQAWQTIEPGTQYIDNWHIHLIGEYMQAVNLGQTRRLIINIPPRHMKSIEATICYPAWTWTKDPGKRFIKVSYSDNLSRKHNILTRDIIRSPWFCDNWGDTVTLKDDVNRQNEFKNSKLGFMYSTSVGGALTGEGGDVIIIDDPQNPLMANSEAEREASINFFKNTLQTRLNDPKKGAIIIIMQRLHENDMTGYILSENIGYEHLCLPAIAPERTIITFPISKKEIVREEGDLLNAGRFDKQVLDDLKKSMGSLQFSGQFQQTPAPAEGIIFKREWMTNFYTLAPKTMDIQSWDMAFTKSEGSAKVAGFVMGKAEADIYIKDLTNDKMDFTESVVAVRTLSGKHPKARAKVVENKANGPAIVNTLKKEIPGMVEFNPKGSKEERAMSVTPYFEAGNIWFPDPKTNPWVEDLIRDLLIFPKGTYKDTVDALVQGILYLMDKHYVPLSDIGSGLGKKSYWKEQEAKSWRAN
ncbi:phage terminase large subunit [Lachnospiraceae bacterium ZAX-1]